MASIRAFILDMDGVLWRDEEPIGNLRKLFSDIQQAGIKITLATNNASRSSFQHLDKLRSFGVEGLEPWQVVSSSDAVAAYLRKKYPQGGGIYVVGEPPLVKVIEDAGYFFDELKPVAVVAGIDRTVNYSKLNIAGRLIRNGADFVGTNPDKTYPTPEGLAPGAGTILAALEAVSGVKPWIVGKPSPAMYQIALERLGMEPNAVLVVGDRIETDIVGGQALGCKTALVLSGVTTLSQAKTWLPQPDFIMTDLTALFEAINLA